ncbi:hypothetical protein DPMN_063962 [Dreissena polymorpha]|uniref:Uncharacterized protein n=1 Tax=Dreissena polymorpha TaxID=45954 RepID=A0A9D4CBG4_DREPO|nr:hypothetical protein DPMN_063962 [Dreissena polymorpha]
MGPLPLRSEKELPSIDGQTEQVLDKQFQQLPHQAQALQIPRSVHSTLRLLDVKASCGHSSNA